MSGGADFVSMKEYTERLHRVQRRIMDAGILHSTCGYVKDHHVSYGIPFAGLLHVYQCDRCP